MSKSKYVVKRTSPQARTKRFKADDGRKLVLPHNGNAVWSLSPEDAQRLAALEHTKVTPVAPAPVAPAKAKSRASGGASPKSSPSARAAKPKGKKKA